MPTKQPKQNSKASQHAHFRRALKKAQGRSEQVIVVFVDVRGFSAFSGNHDSADIALYVRRLFLSLIEEHFPGADYHKSTGDGMLIIYPYKEKTLDKIAKQVIQSALGLYVGFAGIASADNMITFDVPQACGIGINRGTVCCIESAGETIDYSGHVLNLAARLMDLARPEGIVMHASLGNMIPEEFKDTFQISSVYVRGIAENQPVPIYSLKGVTLIPTSATLPPPLPWGETSKKWTVAELKKLPSRFAFSVPNTVTKNDDVVVRFYTRGTLEGLRVINEVTKFIIKKVADKTELSIDLKPLRLLVNGHADTDLAHLEVKYRQK